MSGENHNSKRYMHPSVYCGTIYNSQATEAMSIHRGVDEKRVWHIYSMDNYSAIKENEVMPFALTQMDLGLSN